MTFRQCGATQRMLCVTAGKMRLADASSQNPNPSLLDPCTAWQHQHYQKGRSSPRSAVTWSVHVYSSTQCQCVAAGWSGTIWLHLLVKITSTHNAAAQALTCTGVHRSPHTCRHPSHSACCRCLSQEALCPSHAGCGTAGVTCGGNILNWPIQHMWQYLHQWQCWATK